MSNYNREEVSYKDASEEELVNFAGKIHQKIGHLLEKGADDRLIEGIDVDAAQEGYEDTMNHVLEEVAQRNNINSSEKLEEYLQEEHSVSIRYRGERL